MSLFEELKRRNVFRVGIAYGVASWLVLQMGDILLEAFGAPEWSMRLVVTMLLLGLPVVLFIAWAFELTPEGIKKESEVDRSQSIVRHTGRKLDLAIIVTLVLAVSYFAFDKFVLRTGVSNPPVAVPAQPELPAVAAPAAKTLPTDKSIAVLPFENRSNRDEDAFFTSGIHDDLLTQLAQISSLRVISRTSVAQFAGTSSSIREIAGLLNVATILEGGVQRAGNQVRINMQLIDAATDAHLWAQTFDRELTADNIFAIQSEVASAVAVAMRATLTQDEVARIAQVPTRNMGALEEYFKGRAEMDTRSLSSIQSARLRFERARELDPSFAQAWASEAQSILLLSDRPTSYGDIPVPETLRLARPLVERAYQLAPDDPLVLAVYGLLETAADDFAAALDYLDRSLAIDPHNGEVLNWKRLILYPLGRGDEAMALAERMVEADPLSMITLYNAIATLAFGGAGEPQFMAGLLDRLEGIDPAAGLDARGLVAEIAGDKTTAIGFKLQALAKDPDKSNVRMDIGHQLAELGLYAEARNVDPRAEQYLSSYALGWAENLRLHQAELALAPDSLDARMAMLWALYRNRQFEDVVALGEQLWAQYGAQPAQLGQVMFALAEAARRTERPDQAARYRDAFAQMVQWMERAAASSEYRFYAQARLAAFDGRDADALVALNRAVDLGMRWEGMLTDPGFERLGSQLEFQSVKARMQELAARERMEIQTLLCADGGLAGWVPAAETCAI